MSVPGSNLLAQALTVIAPATAQYYAFTGRTTNAIGLDVATYAAPITVRASIQAVDRKMIEEYGLDLQRTYIMVYIQRSVIAIDRDVSGDQIIFNSQKYNLISDTQWFPMDGWVGVICVKVPS